MKIPEFTEWTKFDEYKTYEHRGLPGVYLMAKFQRKPKGQANPRSSRIIYIGETTKQTLSRRLYQFSRSAFLRQPAHSGGWSFSDKVLCSKKCGSAPSDLHVAFVAIDKKFEEAAAFIKAIERVLIWEYLEQHGRFSFHLIIHISHHTQHAEKGDLTPIQQKQN